MKKIAVSKIQKGGEFSAFEHEYIALDTINGGVLALEKSTLDIMPFGKNNNWHGSSIREYLNGEYLDDLEKNGLSITNDDILKMNIDLKATDGSREYGIDTCYAGLLTLEQYFRYNEFIPLADNPWWLATPWGTPKNRSPDTDNAANAWLISTSGGASFYSTSYTGYGPRPALLFNPSLLVTVDAGDGMNKDELIGLITSKLKEVLV